MPPKKRAAAAAAGSDPATDEPPVKRQTRSRKAKDSDAPTGDDNQDATQANTTQNALVKKSSRAKTSKAAIDDSAVSDEVDSKPATTALSTKQSSRAKKTKAATVNQLDDADADDGADAADKEVCTKAKASKKAPKSKAVNAAGGDPADAIDDDAAADSKPKTAPPNKNLHIPVDEGCHLAAHRVFIDPSGVIYDGSLNQTNASNNNNKFYRAQLLQGAGGDYRTWTRWGRVGEHGQSKLLGDGSFDLAKKEFEKKFKDKSGLAWANRLDDPKSGKYVFLEKSYEPDDPDEAEEPQAAVGASRGRSQSPPKCTLDPAVRSLMQLIFNQGYFEATMNLYNYDANKLPLGKLSKLTITRGFQALKDLAALLDAGVASSGGESVEGLSNRYYSLIPHAFGRNRPPVINNKDTLKREVELLESLTDLKDADDILKAEDDSADTVHPLDFQYQSLGMSEMTALDEGSLEFRELSKYLINTRGSTHIFDYRVESIFRIERQGETERFDKSPYAGIASDRRLLWHGSRTTNYGGILSQGLRIAPPEAPVSGYMFDKGIYLADMSSKSANYCYAFMSGNTGLLMLCEAELGAPMQVLQDAQYDAGSTAKKQGMHSTWGQGSEGPLKWKDAGVLHQNLQGVKMPDVTEIPGDTGLDLGWGGLQYSEYICYDVAQVRLRYLFRVNMS